MPPVNRCQICDGLPPGDLTELDALMGDASRWPSTVWGIFEPPKGAPNALRLRFGARQMAIAFFAQRGYGPFSREVIDRHYRFDVPIFAADPVELLNRGIIAATAQNSAGGVRTKTVEKIDPGAYLTYFNRGIKLGNRALEVLAARFEEMVAKGEDVPLAMLKMLIDSGAKLAVTQASLKRAGVNLDGDDELEEGFRAGSGPVGPRIGQTRIRTIEGETRPVADKGPADRAHFSERAKAEGGEGLPH